MKMTILCTSLKLQQMLTLKVVAAAASGCSSDMEAANIIIIILLLLLLFLQQQGSDMVDGSMCPPSQQHLAMSHHTGSQSSLQHSQRSGKRCC